MIYKFETDNQQEALNMIFANHMKAAIDGYYQEIFRPIFKHGQRVCGRDLTDSEIEILEEIHKKLNEYFAEMVNI